MGKHKTNNFSKEQAAKHSYAAKPTPSPSKGGSKLSELQQKFKAKLEGGRFRFINEKLYTSESGSAFVDFQQDPSQFYAYHEGYRKQVESWPINPLDTIIDWIKKKMNKGAPKPQSVEGSTSGSVNEIVVADMGCGEARLGRTLKSYYTTARNNNNNNVKQPVVYSFDLVGNMDIDRGAVQTLNPAVHSSKNSSFRSAGSPQDAVPVIACDVSNVPLSSASVDVVVFCLSLMGTNMVQFLQEAHRILRVGGAVKIVEVRSRFHSSNTVGTDSSSSSSNSNRSGGGSNNSSSLNKFLRVVEKIGFKVVHTDANLEGADRTGGGSESSGNKMFFHLEATKLADSSSGNSSNPTSSAASCNANPSSGSKNKGQAPAFQAKPCVYKKR